MQWENLTEVNRRLEFEIQVDSSVIVEFVTLVYWPLRIPA